MSEAVEIYAIYEKPSDYPDLFVVRKFLNDVPQEIAGVAETLEKARQYLPKEKGLVNIGQDPEDPNIVEVWM